MILPPLWLRKPHVTTVVHFSQWCLEAEGDNRRHIASENPGVRPAWDLRRCVSKENIQAI